jgi:hypothetical protein
MKRIAIVLICAVVALLLSLFPVWNFSERIAIPSPVNPLWTDHNQAIASSLTEELKQQGYLFQTDRGAEADPEGICFGHFGSDEYWVIQYHADRKEVDAYAWIIGINWIGHLAAASRFSRLEETLKTHLQ